jgi:dTDP-4-dehydrorhamnose 3,5-epimerase-like enzyme
MEKDMKELMEEYKENVFDDSQPFLIEIYHLTKNNSNDMDLGKAVRKLVYNYENYKKGIHLAEADRQLKKIIQ